MKKRNQAIGECPCPTRDCVETAAVFKFAGTQEAGKTRFAGKLYLRCPTHGRLGADGAAGMQEFILENAKIWDEGNKAARASAPEKAAPSLVQSRSAPQPTPQPSPPPAPVKRRDLWDL